MKIRVQEPAKLLEAKWRCQWTSSTDGGGDRVLHCWDLGSGQGLDYKVLGSPVNLAARLEGLAVSKVILLD